ncbi:MAG: SIS domain-containing protein [Pelagibacteraceae bacterium TMED124]|nr:MAG: SIS domain-containing protein [Pelagibacteraceae bacterium TMED124]|tara:strand:- start:174 stop:740 length:567 start_codon:yes stop_codon:yes gene_type:complete
MNIEKFLSESRKDYESLFSQKTLNEIREAAELCTNSLLANKKILLCGNGGSAADAQHFSAELVCRFTKNRRSLPAISLVTDTSLITAVSNDFDFSNVFERQIEGLGQRGDTLIAYSTSGKSENIIKAVRKAKEIGLQTIVMTGSNLTILHKLSDKSLRSSSSFTAVAQQSHSFMGHLICLIIEDSLFP